jgi:protein-L-isoaspartate(D-aspartate) O-methyltransferase
MNLPRVAFSEALGPAVESAFSRVDRMHFVPIEWIGEAYHDHPLPIGYGQTISQPSLVALMTDHLDLTSESRVLEIGTGSGYQTAILAEICREVYTIEIIPDLAEEAAKRLHGLGYTNIHFHIGDGHLGWPEFAPFDAIIVTAATQGLPSCLLQQMSEESRLIIPVGSHEHTQRLWLIERNGEAIRHRQLLDVRFVPLILESAH